ncbi:hypothetical protein GCM10022238_25100 [Gordonia hankookensis]
MVMTQPSVTHSAEPDTARRGTAGLRFFCRWSLAGNIPPGMAAGGFTEREDVRPVGRDETPSSFSTGVSMNVNDPGDEQA